jgi:hypothetical protein
MSHKDFLYSLAMLGILGLYAAASVAIIAVGS